MKEPTKTTDGWIETDVRTGAIRVMLGIRHTGERRFELRLMGQIVRAQVTKVGQLSPINDKGETIRWPAFILPAIRAADEARILSRMLIVAQTESAKAAIQQAASEQTPEAGAPQIIAP